MKKLRILFLTLLLPMFLLSYDNITAQTPSYISGPIGVACNSNAVFFFNPGTVREMVLTGPGDPDVVPIQTVDCDPIANWTVRLPNGSIRTFSARSSISVNLGSTPGSASISATTSCGNMGQTSTASRSVVVGGVRLSTPSLAGAYFLCNNSSATYTISAVSGAVSYTVQAPSGWRINNSSATSVTTTNRTITLRAPSSGISSGQIRVRANAGTGCDINSNFRTRNISYGRRSIDIFGPTSTAPYNLITYNCSSLGISNFNWTVPSSWNLWSGTNQSGIVVESPGSEGTYTIRVTGTSCGVTVSKSINVRVSRGGGPIEDPGGGGIFIVGEGDVGLEKGNGEITKSNADIIKMFPNPASDVLNFRGSKNQEISSLELFDLQGKRVRSQLVDVNSPSMDVKNLNTGLYIVQILMKDGSSLMKKVQINN
ncbi:T9SS type A sorting domain-containing protein [uncultured Aquimarina sp.]|uniref:T9SS type A sorting domain-containing protein n=1 Tax=uncultured Aquimarina sp. TaxID=575652 RepID=UPI00260FDDED|nr:T9SS type A sorting domain-containing protein [uncultured Aquimarina sp.]